MPTTPTAPATPLMTFVITCYDLPADMLRECVTAIFSLAFQPGEREVIVIDDGSKLPAITDIDDVKDQIIYLRQPNSGLACARNMGIRVATGRYIQFVDGDDYLLRVPYEHCLDLVRYHNPDMVLFDFSTRSSVATPYSYEGPMSGSEYMQGHNLHGTACGYIFSRELLGSLRFTAGILHEDEEFTPQLILRAERLFYTDAKAYYYRQRRGSIMHADAANHIDKRLSDSLAVILRLQQMAATMPETDRQALARRVAQLTMDYLYNTIQLTYSRQRLDDAIATLEQQGLYPLPDKRYTRKYWMFRRLVQSKMGRSLLLYIVR